MKLIAATENQGKIYEFRKLLNPMGIDIITFKELGICSNFPEETGSTFKENAKIKAEHAYKLTGLPSVADDSGLEVDALGGAPGIFSARYAGEYADDNVRIEKLLNELKDISTEKRTARFVCAICCILSEEEKIFSVGKCSGLIAVERKGNSGFGYDSIFVYKNGETFSEMSPDMKNVISHRGAAIRDLGVKLSNRIKKENFKNDK